MIPIGPLMREHRLIERMIRLMEDELRRIREENRADTDFIESAVDFIRTYADRCHHGKEEDILFRDLLTKPLSSEHERIIRELTEEHVYGRKLAGRLVEARERYIGGDGEALKDLETHLNELVQFYPNHIEKEDKHFFYPCMDYFSKEEQNRMLQEFWDFDRTLIHEKYDKMVETLKGRHP